MIKGFLTVGTWTLISRVLGMGAAEAFNMAFVPLDAKKLAAEGAEVVARDPVAGMGPFRRASRGRRVHHARPGVRHGVGRRRRCDVKASEPERAVATAV